MTNFCQRILGPLRGAGSFDKLLSKEFSKGSFRKMLIFQMKNNEFCFPPTSSDKFPSKDFGGLGRAADPLPSFCQRIFGPLRGPGSFDKFLSKDFGAS